MEERTVLPVDGFERKKLTASELPGFFRGIRQRYPDREITFLCIGTDRSTGDALGPLVGTRLAEHGFPHVVGTLQFPCDADNLELRMAAIPREHVIVAIDACLGASASVGSYLVSGQPLVPAQSVGVTLPAVGHYSVAAVVNVNGPKPYWTLQMTSLYQVMRMADVLADSIVSGFRTI
ncbi:spore protease YyaC [Paenibacillus sp. M1]|uniref:Spore protease YyaC n=1 Tax=Paenibacillus haidiansis TaxID=1574488 RepID=A0ABU7W154_9BACL